jgi:Ca2+-binding RTX toxin-like protein
MAISTPSVTGTDQSENITGTDAGERILGLAGDDYLYGGKGDDTLAGGLGSDTLAGGEGNDTYVFERGMGKDVLDIISPLPWGRDDAQFETIQMAPGIQPEELLLIVKNNRDLVIMLGDGLDSITVPQDYVFGFNQGLPGYIDRIVFDNGVVWSSADIDAAALAQLGQGTPQNDVLGGTSRSDTIRGRAGNDYIYGSDGDDSLLGQDGADTLSGDAGRDTLEGGAGNDKLDGRDGADLLIGGDGDDTLMGDTDNDTLDGGAGNDVYDSVYSQPYSVSTYVWGRGDGNDTLIAGGGVLKLSSDMTPGDLLVRASPMVDDVHGGDFSAFDLRIQIKGSTDTFLVKRQMGKDGENGVLTGFAFADGTVWTQQDLTAKAFEGTALDDVIRGYASRANNLAGLAGNDVLEGGANSDSLGGDMGDDTLRGLAGNDSLDGGLGQDWLDGGLGSDTLVGGGGSDVYLFERDVMGWDLVDASPLGDTAADEFEVIRMGQGIRANDLEVRREGNDLVIESRYASGITGQTDRMRVQGNFQLDAQGQTISLIDSVNFGGDPAWDAAEIIRRTQWLNQATSGDDLLLGNVQNNALAGADGQDSLYGFDGNDQLSGGAGNDLLDGSLGDDTLYGGAGADTMSGGSGSDLYYVDSAADRVIEASATLWPDTLRDTVATNLSDYTLPTNVENLVMGGKAGDSPEVRSFLSGKAGLRHGVGNSDDNLMTGDLGSESFEGLAGNDVLRGGGGDDTLAGGAGDDVLEGGQGNDTYVLRQSLETRDYLGLHLDTINELAGEGSGIDTVDTDYTSYTAAANIEQVFTTGASVTGNELNNLLRGSAAYTYLSGAAGDDTLDGGGGSDQFAGGKGNDLLIASATDSSDVFLWGAGEGADTLRDAGGNDRLIINGNVQSNQLWFSREGDALKVAIIGTPDSFTVEGWYQGPEHQVEDIGLSGGKSLNVAKVQQLVDAMASFTPPAPGQTALPADVAAQLAPVIASAWG